MQEANINLEVFNLETDFFGDLHCSSRFTDMLCDAQVQYGDYSVLDECPMWGMWGNEGDEKIKAQRKTVGGGDKDRSRLNRWARETGNVLRA